uniref:Uncharacterized protein n=1 Tax=Arundo donax TaxID=35708 RepID=A0A0A9EFD5_ARUDO
MCCTSHGSRNVGFAQWLEGNMLSFIHG